MTAGISIDHPKYVLLAYLKIHCTQWTVQVENSRTLLVPTKAATPTIRLLQLILRTIAGSSAD